MASGERGTVVNGRYRLEELIGTGGFGETWRAYDELLGMPVAVKAFFGSDPRRRERFLREARNLARFWKEPGIVGVRDYFEEGDRFYLVMEYLEGEDLNEYLRHTGALSADQAVQLLAPAMRTLQKLHDGGLIHRDVSPENLRILPDGQVKLLDFGSAMSTNADQQGKTVTVKSGYAPPEQYGDPEKQGPWTDVYSLAATIWLCLTIRKPLDSLQRAFHDDLPAPSTLGVPISPQQEAALMRALALDPRERTQSVAELMAGLQGAGGGAGVSAAVGSAVPPTTGRHPGDVMPTASHGQGVEGPVPKASPREGAVAPERRPREASGVERKRESRRKSKLPLVAGIAVAALVAVVGIFAFTQVNANPYADSIGNSRISDTVVGEDVLAAVARDKDNKTLTLTRCQVGDEAIAQIAQMEGLEKLYLNECIGYTSLDPLAENESLQGICIEGYDGFDGDAMMSVEFPHVTELAFKLVRFKGTSGFLNHFPALEELELSPQEGIGDIEFLASCPNMATLTVDGMDLSGDKWKPLAGCSELYYVSLNYCNLDTLEWAANCYKLYTVKAVGNSITTLEGLQSSESLNEAYLNDNQISDISALSESTSLYTLSLSGNQIADVSAIRNADQLRRLGLADNQLTDESAASLGELTSLEQLDVSGNQLTNLDFCERLIGLKALSAHDNAIVSIDKLASCSSLEDLFLQHNQIASIDALGNDFENLEELNIAYNQISSLAPLAGNGALKDLVANDNQITSLEGMENKPSLGAVLLDNNQISDISGLSGSIGKLWFLDLGHNQVSDVSLLSGMGTTYEGYYDIVLLLDHNQVTNVDMLPAIGHWRALALYANPLESISFLDNESFEWNAVYIPHSDSFDYAAVQGLGGFLADLKIVDCPYDAQAKIVRDIDEAGTGSAYPLFITGEEADADLLALREELNSRVSGEGTAASEIEKPSMDEEGEEAAEGSEGQEGAGIAEDDAAAEGAESEG